jgi:hypothetical protein
VESFSRLTCACFLSDLVETLERMSSLPLVSRAQETDVPPLCSPQPSHVCDADDEVGCRAEREPWCSRTRRLQSVISRLVCAFLSTLALTRYVSFTAERDDGKKRP